MLGTLRLSLRLCRRCCFRLSSRPLPSALPTESLSSVSLLVPPRLSRSLRRLRAYRDRAFDALYIIQKRTVIAFGSTGQSWMLYERRWELLHDHGVLEGSRMSSF